MFKKLFSQTIIAIVMTFAAVNANATLITQDIIVNDGVFTLGTVTIEVNDADLGNGLLSVFEFVDLTLLGVPVFDVFAFEAVIDGDDVFAGIEFLFFDVQERGFDFWNYQLLLDAANPVNSLDIFDNNGNVIFFSDDLSFGQPTVVPEPAAIALILMGLISLRLRRKA